MEKLLPILIVLLLMSCSEKKNRPSFYDSDDETLTISEADNEFTEYTSDDIISVPFREDSGIKYVKVSVNGVGFDMIFDTGCSMTLISTAEARYLYSKGYLIAEDIVGTTQARIADGRIVENMVVKLREVVIGDKILCKDVYATVSSNNNSPLLLGNEILDRVASYSIDNKNKVIKFKLK